MSTATAAPEAQPATTNDPQPAPGDATGTPHPNGGTGGGKTFTQAELDAIVKERLAREQAKREQAEAKARADAEADALAKNQEFKALADKRAERIAELEAKAGQVETLQQELDRHVAIVDALVKQRREGLPDHIIELLEGKDAVAQLDFLNRHPELTESQPLNPGIKPVPKAAGNLSKDELLRREIAAQRERIR